MQAENDALCIVKMGRGDLRADGFQRSGEITGDHQDNKSEHGSPIVICRKRQESPWTQMRGQLRYTEKSAKKALLTSRRHVRFSLPPSLV